MSGYPANLTCTELAFPVLLYICHAVYRLKWLEGHLYVAPPPPPPPKKKKKKKKSQFRGQGIHTVISLHDLRDAYLENTSGLSFEMGISNDASQCNSNDVSRCNLEYTWSKIRSFEWSFKMCNSNDNSNYALCSRVKTVFHYSSNKLQVSILKNAFTIFFNCDCTLWKIIMSDHISCLQYSFIAIIHKQKRKSRFHCQINEIVGL